MFKDVNYVSMKSGLQNFAIEALMVGAGGKV